VTSLAEPAAPHAPGISLRIALIAPNRFPIRQPFAGGLEAHVWHLARALTQAGHRVTLFAAMGSEAADQPGLTVNALKRSAAASHPFPLPGAVFESDHHAYVALMRELADGRRKDFDVVHNHSLHQVPIAMAAALRTPMVSTFHTPPFSWLESVIGAARTFGITYTAVSRHTADVWGRIADGVLVVHNGVDVDRWPAGSGGPYVAWSGRITPEKGPHLAIEAARRAGRRIVLAGPIGNADYFRGKVEPLLGDGACYAGHLDQEKLASLVGGAAAVLVTPQWDEPYCLVVAEALVCGTPVVAFERGGIPEVLDPQCGRLVRPDDVAAMAAAIPEAIALSRTAVRDRAIATCGASSMVEGYVAIYRGLIEERDGGTDDRLLRPSSRSRAPRPSDQHLRTPA
jgi:glycosyltransferase involved in cell wall biosynthesis